MHRVAAADLHGRAHGRQLLRLLKRIPHHAGHRARAVAERQPQVLTAVAALAALGLANEQNLVDLHAVCELV